MSVRKWPAGIHQIGHGAGRQHRLSFHQHQMQADAQRRHRLGARHGVGGGGARHHQAGGGQNAVAMGAFDRLIDFDGGAEIVGGDDELFHRAQETIMSSRFLRNWKNSTPSRRRRTSMSREVSISLTISMILEGRK